MHLRSFRPSDLQTLYEIDQGCFPTGISYSREELARFIAHRHAETWIAEDEGRIVAFLIADHQPRQIAHIITIDVVANMRRRHVGSLLMDAAEAWAHREGLRLVYLETAEDNLVAQSFYQARGYRRMGRVDNYYGNGLAAWVMAKALQGRSAAGK